MKPSAVPDQRFDVLVSTRLDQADEQHVIPRGVQRMMPAFQPRNTALDQWRRRMAEPEAHAGEAIGVRARESPRELDLIMRENVHRIALGAFEGHQAARAHAQAPGDERWIERNGVERARGESDERIVVPARRDDRDACRELGERVAELLFEGNLRCAFGRQG